MISFYQDQRKFVDVFIDVNAKARIVEVVTSSGYQGFAAQLIPNSNEAEQFIRIFNNINVPVQVENNVEYDYIIHPTIGVSTEEMDHIRDEFNL